MSSKKVKKIGIFFLDFLKKYHIKDLTKGKDFVRMRVDFVDGGFCAYNLMGYVFISHKIIPKIQKKENQHTPPYLKGFLDV